MCVKQLFVVGCKGMCCMEITAVALLTKTVNLTDLGHHEAESNVCTSRRERALQRVQKVCMECRWGCVVIYILSMLFFLMTNKKYHGVPKTLIQQNVCQQYISTLNFSQNVACFNFVFLHF